MPPPVPPTVAQAPVYRPMLMTAKPGIQKDGTLASQDKYSDGTWTRFDLDLPRKILGYREQVRDLGGIVRALDVQSYDGYSYVHAGSQSVLERYAINIDSELTTSVIDRTPASNFVTSDSNNWQFTVMYNTATAANLLFAHAAPNILDISSTAARYIFYGEVRDTAALVPLAPTDPADIYQVSGGVVSLWPYLVRYGQDGFVGWSKPGEPLTTSGTGSGTARPSGTKIVRGMALRGTSGPSCLLWSLDALVRMQFVGGSAIFQFDSISTSSAIMSSNGIIEHMGVYYWATVSGFAAYNGVMRNVPNNENVQFFLDNVNMPYRQKIFAFKIPRWNEIWWCFPKGDSTECNHAVIYKIDKGYWYDTPLPAAMRSAGVYEQIYNHPIMCSPLLNTDTAGYSAWQHEFGLDEVSGPTAQSQAILASIRTNEKSMIMPQAGQGFGADRNMSFNLLEPDFLQQGDLNFRVYSRANARATQRVSATKTIVAVPTTPQEELVKFNHQGRLNAFEIESNTLGGDFFFGMPLVHTVPGDGRRED